MVTSKGGWPRGLLGGILVERRKVHLRDEIQEEEHQVVFGQRVSRRNRLLAALLGVPGAVLLASIVHDLTPAWGLKGLELGGATIVPASTHSVKIDRSGIWLGGRAVSFSDWS
jgi:hypothetical protein